MSTFKNTTKTLTVAVALCCGLGATPASADIAWQQLPGAAVDVGAGGSGQVWVTNAQQNIFRWANGTWMKMPGAAVRVAVDPKGNAWVVSADHNLYEWVNNNWAKRTGLTLPAVADVAVGAGGAVWALTPDQRILFKGPATWTPYPGAAVRVSVGTNGYPWIVNAQGKIYEKTGNNFQERPGTARGVAVCGNGSVYTIGMDGAPYKWNGSTWEKRHGGPLLNIACDGQGRLFATSVSQQIYTGIDAAAPTPPKPATPGAAPTPPAAGGAPTWVPATGPNIPPTATRGGNESNGQPLFLCRANFQGAVVPGKTRKELGGCDFSYGGREARVPQYEVLTTPLTNWVKANTPVIPPGALVGGKLSSGAPLSICRAAFQGGVHMGFAAPGLGCHFGYGGKEVTVPAYEVLMAAASGSPATPATPTPTVPTPPGAPTGPAAAGAPVWMHTAGGNIPPTAFRAGQEASGQPLYVCRAAFQGALQPGKTRREYNGCDISFGGKEVRVPVYEVLAIQPSH